MIEKHLNSVILGDCGDVMKTFPEQSIDTIITDPPYGIKFMGKKWDYQIPSLHIFKEMLNVAKPGATLLCFGGARTFHRMAINIEDAGWEIRDCMMWLYGSGFPKSMDISKAIDNQLGVTRNIIGTLKTNTKMQGNNYIGSKLDAKGGVVTVTEPFSKEAKQWRGFGTALKPAYEPIIVAMKPLETTFAHNALHYGVSGFNIDNARITGRFPANIILDEISSDMLDVQSGPLKSGGKVRGTEKSHTGQNGIYGTYPRVENNPFDDAGGASRFFYCAKASQKERNHGRKIKNDHPTVKPLKLIEYLCKLTKTPTGGIILDPFAGSGTMGVAAIKTQRPFILIEKEPKYIEIINQRLNYKKKEAIQYGLFDKTQCT